ncbi:acetoacetate decarboxylase [Methylocella silvestris]|uniref:Acetoacetate decarboxylase n=1 Tax=Methylocella silvestris TaxID=199596 RepID=A0A2J7TFD6_METSI|nr:acetoacetate decarboxylase [Methylocella silvestris]PNG25485.1 acetoacetate decarboxylase [Methylocella silvestris]
MKIDEIAARAFAMPLNDPSYPPGPYRFYNREFMVISYRTDPSALRAVLPEPLEPVGDIVKYEFIRMPDSTGFGDYTETGQVIPVSFRGERGSYVHSMYLDDEAPIAGGREIWGFPKKLAKPTLAREQEVLVGKLTYGSVLCAVATMGYKHKILDLEPTLRALDEPNFLIKIIPDVDGSPRICELVRYHMQDVDLKGAWSGPAALQLFNHVAADVARLPVLDVVSATHFIGDMTLGLGEVVHDYLSPSRLSSDENAILEATR